eukprot:2690713-Pyramimonas_sp.AAC.1
MVALGALGSLKGLIRVPLAVEAFVGRSELLRSNERKSVLIHQKDLLARLSTHEKRAGRPDVLSPNASRNAPHCQALGFKAGQSTSIECLRRCITSE